MLRMLSILRYALAHHLHSDDATDFFDKCMEIGQSHGIGVRHILQG